MPQFSLKLSLFFSRCLPVEPTERYFVILAEQNKTSVAVAVLSAALLPLHLLEETAKGLRIFASPKECILLSARSGRRRRQAALSS